MWGLFPQRFPAGCKEKETDHLNAEGTMKVPSTDRQGVNWNKELVGKEELRRGLIKQGD